MSDRPLRLVNMFARMRMSIRPRQCWLRGSRELYLSLVLTDDTASGTGDSASHDCSCDMILSRGRYHGNHY